MVYQLGLHQLQCRHSHVLEMAAAVVQFGILLVPFFTYPPYSLGEKNSPSTSLLSNLCCGTVRLFWNTFHFWLGVSYLTPSPLIELSHGVEATVSECLGAHSHFKELPNSACHTLWEARKPTTSWCMWYKSQQWFNLIFVIPSKTVRCFSALESLNLLSWAWALKQTAWKLPPATNATL